METLNTGFFFVADKIVSLQGFFMKEAWRIGRYVLIISLSLAAINYAISGQGLKENLVKIGKALIFFIIIMGIYPRLISFIVEWTFQKAYDSTYVSIERYVEDRKTEIADTVESSVPGEKSSYINEAMTSENVSSDRDPLQYFSQMTRTRQFGDMTYTVVAPAATMEILLMVAGECLRYAGDAPRSTMTKMPDLVQVAKGLLCAFTVMLTGIFAMVEYLLAYLEFMLVSGVGIILFPLSIWEGSKFLAEKLIGAIIGFFVKLLFCNICIFLLLYGYVSLIRGFAARPFTGQPDEILVVLFVSLLFFYICKSAPALAQSLLTGTPSLSAQGAIGAAVSAIGAGASVLGLARKGGGLIADGAGKLAGGTTKAAFAGGGMLSQAMGASSAVKTLGGDSGAQRGAFLRSMGGSAKEAFLSGGGELARSLLGSGRSGGGGHGHGLNRHSQRQGFLDRTNADGTKKTFGEYLAGRKEAGINAGQDYMLKRETKQNERQAKRENR